MHGIPGVTHPLINSFLKGIGIIERFEQAPKSLRNMTMMGANSLLVLLNESRGWRQFNWLGDVNTKRPM